VESLAESVARTSAESLSPAARAALKIRVPSHLAPREISHPSDNRAAVLGASALVRTTGATLLTPLAGAYQVQCRLSDSALLTMPSHDQRGNHEMTQQQVAGANPFQSAEATADPASSHLHVDAQRVSAAGPEDRERAIDAAVDMTFPASDPPAWMGSMIASSRGARTGDVSRRTP